MKIISTRLLDVEDLKDKSLTKSFEEITYLDFEESCFNLSNQVADEYPITIFIDSNLNTKIIKNRYGSI